MFLANGAVSAPGCANTATEPGSSIRFNLSGAMAASYQKAAAR
jgi:hypothetical protein